MARTSRPLEAKPPPRRDSSIPAELWELPARVVRLGRLKFEDQKALAEASGLTQPTISKTLGYKNLRRFDARTAIKLAAALETTVGFLLAGEGERFPQRHQNDTPAPTSEMRQSAPPNRSFSAK